MFVYNRPNYSRLRLAYPELTKLEAMRMACLGTDIPKLTEITRLSVKNTSSRVPSATKKRANRSAFSSDLGVVEEDLYEDDESSHVIIAEEDDYTEQTLEEGTNHGGTNHDPVGADDEQPQLGSEEGSVVSMSLEDSYNSDDLEFEEEYRQVFLDAALGAKRINMDGHIQGI